MLRLQQLGILSLVLLMSCGAAGAEQLASGWKKVHQSQVRLLAGVTQAPDDGAHMIAGVQLQLEPKWKTYWRSPGEAGGVPPVFDWSKSTNIKDVAVDFPAPMRLSSPYGDNIGYVSEVVFPIRFVVADPEKPAQINVSFEYGICEDICIPANVDLVLTMPPGLRAPMPASLVKALDQIPRRHAQLTDKDPRLEKAEFVLSGDKPKLLLDTVSPTSDISIDVFVEGPGATYMPMAKKISALNSGRGRFEVDLSHDVNLADLKGKEVRVTLVGDSGQSEFLIPAK